MFYLDIAGFTSEQITGIAMLVLGIVLVLGGVISCAIKYRKYKKEQQNGPFYNKNIPAHKIKK